jgi:hypothetical protein
MCVLHLQSVCVCVCMCVCVCVCVCVQTMCSFAGVAVTRDHNCGSLHTETHCLMEAGRSRCGAGLAPSGTGMNLFHALPGSWGSAGNLWCTVVAASLPPPFVFVLFCFVFLREALAT